VAAALRAPAIRYRSFGNEPVRTPVPAPDADPYALLGAAMNAAAEIGQQQGMPPAEAWQPPESPPQPAAPRARAEPLPAWTAPEPAPQWMAPDPAPAWSAPEPTPAPAPAPAPVQAAPQYWPEPAAHPTWSTPQASAPQSFAPQWAEPAQEPPATPGWVGSTPVTHSESVVAPAPVMEAPAAPAAEPYAAAPAAAAPVIAAPLTEAPVPETPAAATPVPEALAAPTPVPETLAAPTPVAETRAVTGWTPAPEAIAPKAEAAPGAPLAPAARPSYGIADMGLLRAADMAMAPPAPRPLLSTLAALSVAPTAAQKAEQAQAPRALFPLIEALDMPGGLLARRVAPNGLPDGLSHLAAPAPEDLPAPAAQTVLAAAEIDLPLAELLRLLAADPADSADAFLALRRPPRADHLVT